MYRFVFFVLIALITVACEHENDATKVNQIEQLSRFNTSYGEILCNLNLRCNLGILPIDQDQCKSTLPSEFLYPPGLRFNNIDRQFNAEAGNHCLDKLNTMSCEEVYQALYADYSVIKKECVLSVTGSKKLNEPCSQFIDCAPGFNCVGAHDGSCGVCRNNGGICEDGSQCKEGKYCDENGVCQNQKKEAQSCFSDETCSKPLFCLDGTCQQGMDINQACDTGAKPCRDGLICMPMQDFNSVCIIPPFGRLEGQNCDGIFSVCGNKLRCDYDQGICVLRILDGLSCQDSSECLLGSWCDQGICSRQQSNHSACTGDAACESQRCIEGVCSENSESVKACLP